MLLSSLVDVKACLLTLETKVTGSLVAQGFEIEHIEKQQVGEGIHV